MPDANTQHCCMLWPHTLSIPAGRKTSAPHYTGGSTNPQSAGDAQLLAPKYLVHRSGFLLLQMSQWLHLMETWDLFPAEESWVLLLITLFDEVCWAQVYEAAAVGFFFLA